jgi:hypothetical protein
VATDGARNGLTDRADDGADVVPADRADDGAADDDHPDHADKGDGSADDNHPERADQGDRAGADEGTADHGGVVATSRRESDEPADLSAAGPAELDLAGTDRLAVRPPAVAGTGPGPRPGQARRPAGDGRGVLTNGGAVDLDQTVVIRRLDLATLEAMDRDRTGHDTRRDGSRNGAANDEDADT